MSVNPDLHLVNAMFFLGDEGQYHGRFPWMTVCILLVNVAMVVPRVLLGDTFVTGYGTVPEEITTGKDIVGHKATNIWVPELDKEGHWTGRDIEKAIVIPHAPGPNPIYLTLLTSMFLHGDYWHFFFNMWFLLIFGRNVECALGHWLYLIFYLACGVLADMTEIAHDPNSLVPSIGASGAIAGMMGAYVAIRPLKWITVWIIIPVELPALFVIGLWAGLQYWSTILDPKNAEGIGYWAHLGGFAAGVVLLWLLTILLILKRLVLGAPRQKPIKPDNTFAPPTKPGHDPYAGFVTMQTVRQMQEKKNRNQQ